MPKPSKRKIIQQRARHASSSRSETALATPKRELPLSVPEAIEKVLIGGDLSGLTPEARCEYYRKVCLSLGLNPWTQPFTYILFREADNSPAKLSLYANKDCAAQLRKIHRISVTALRREISDGMCMVEADVRDGHGKTDSATGVVPLWKWKDRQRIDLIGREWANAVMKTETKAKRRATLSIAGLAFLDESELDTMQVLGGVTPDGRIFKYPQVPTDDAPAALLDENAAHGHPEGSEKAKQAEAALRRVEEEDQRLREAKAVKPKETPVPAEKPSQKQPEPQDVPVLRAEETAKGDFIVTGDVDPVLPMIQHYCTWSDFWHCTPDKLREMAQLQVKLKFRLEISYVKASGAKGASSPKTTTPAGSPAGSAAEPELVKGVIERVTSGMTSKNNPTRQVKIGKAWHTCYVNTIFNFLDKGVGKESQVYLDARKNIVGLKCIGKVEFDVDGRTPCVSRDREPGTQPLFK
jgi:hypothetical protein